MSVFSMLYFSDKWNVFTKRLRKFLLTKKIKYVINLFDTLFHKSKLSLGRQLNIRYEFRIV